MVAKGGALLQTVHGDARVQDAPRHRLERSCQRVAAEVDHPLAAVGLEVAG